MSGNEYVLFGSKAFTKEFSFTRRRGVFDCGLEAFFSEIQDSLRDERRERVGQNDFPSPAAGILKPDEGSILDWLKFPE